MATASVLTEIKKKWFLIGIVVVIALARAIPYIGAKNGNEIARGSSDVEVLQVKKDVIEMLFLFCRTIETRNHS